MGVFVWNQLLRNRGWQLRVGPTLGSQPRIGSNWQGWIGRGMAYPEICGRGMHALLLGARPGRAVHLV
jgi:hypothetical protein